MNVENEKLNKQKLFFKKKENLGVEDYNDWTEEFTKELQWQIQAELKN